MRCWKSDGVHLHEWVQERVGCFLRSLLSAYLPAKFDFSGQGLDEHAHVLAVTGHFLNAV